jgi:ankyrin repeat protein
MVRILIDREADVNAKNNTGDTALSLAKKGGYDDIVNLLKEAGAKG